MASQVLIVNQANAFCQAAFSSDGGSTYMSCPIYLYYRCAHATCLASIGNILAI